LPGTERWLQDQVRALTADLDLTIQHLEDSRRSWLPGWPDLWIAGPNGILYRELKGTNGHATKDQRKVGWTISQAGADWAIWRPSDLLNGRITRELTAISKLSTKTLMDINRR
jgi:hypothetical protein